MISVFLKRLDHSDPELPLPSYESPGAAGADLRAELKGLDHQQMVIRPGERKLIPTGFAAEIPPGYELQVRPRSGLALKTGLMVVNSPGTIDSDYRGEIKIILGNLGSCDEIIRHGDRIAQLVLAPVLQATFVLTKELSETKRGSGGFGHTGRD